MLHKRNTPIVNSPPVRLVGGILEIAEGIACPRCGSAVRGIDAELLEPGIRLLCQQNHHVVICFELV
jgi:hypothetical protein